MELQLRLDLGSLATQKLMMGNDPALVGRVHDAIGHIAAATRANWQVAVHKAKLWSGEREAYADSITWKYTGPMKAEVATDYKNAFQIENGRPAYDMKRMLDTSLKVRTTKGGKRYLIIPFRHNTPGHTAHASSMPDHVYAAAKNLVGSAVKGIGTRLSGTGAMDPKTRNPLTVPQAQYAWGGRLGAGAMGPNPKGKSDRFAGMVRMLEQSGKGKPKSVYLTFRVMMEGSAGWVIAARPGMGIADKVTQEMQATAASEIRAAAAGVVG